MFNYIREVKGELKHVSWPTRKQTMQFTAIVVAISIIIAAYTGVLDVAFTSLLKILIG